MSSLPFRAGPSSARRAARSNCTMWIAGPITTVHDEHICHVMAAVARVGFATRRWLSDKCRSAAGVLGKHPISVSEMGGGSPQWPRVVYSGYSRGMGMQTKVQKWGNSLGVRIPRGLAEEVGLGAGTEVSLTAKDGELVLRPAVPSRLRLADLLAGVTLENIHTSVDTGDAVGAEAF